MKNWIYSLVLLCLSIPLWSQSEKDQIITTLNNYINGTSYNDIPMINKAFYPEAELFLDGREQDLRVMPIAEYTKFFEKGETGQFNGRIGTILSVDHFGNIAMAKVEILMPRAKLRFIDMFILKKIEGEWKIISKTANSKPTIEEGKRILIVVSNASVYGQSDMPTGTSFSEVVEAYDIFDKAGYNIDFVSPSGGPVPLAYINPADQLQMDYLYNPDFMYALKNTKQASALKAEDYEAIYYAGGGGAMFGVPENKTIQQLAMDIYEKQEGVLAAVCHGTAGIVHLKKSDGSYLVADKKISGFPTAYERKDAAYFKTFPFQITETIEEHGGKHVYMPKNTPHMEAQNRVVTGQNHLSTKLVAEKMVELLSSK